MVFSGRCRALAASGILLISLFASSCGSLHHANSGFRIPEREKDDHPEAAAAYDFEKRSPDGVSIPSERYFHAMEHIRRMPLYSTASRAGRGFPGSKNDRRAEAGFSLGSWTPLGPGNIGGRTRALVINPADPNTMYAGGVGGGVWKTTDGGASWNPLNDLMASLSIGALAMDPNDPNTIYAGTGEYFANDASRGAGIFKTADAGGTWTRLAGTANSSFNYVSRIVINPGNSQHVYAATSSGVWGSMDAGDTWNSALARSGADQNGCHDLVIRADQPTDYLLASCGSYRTISLSNLPPTQPNLVRRLQATVFLNTDGAGSGQWVPVIADPNMGRTSLAIAPSNNNVIYALSASNESGANQDGLLAVWRSTDGGAPDSWEARVRNTDAVALNTQLLSSPFFASLKICRLGANEPYSQGDYDNVIAVDPADSNRVWTGGIDVMRSDDGGANWGIASFGYNSVPPQFVHPDQHALVFHPNFNGDGNQTLFDANDGGLFRTDNARAPVATGPKAACDATNTSIEWRSLNNNYAVTQFWHGAPYPGGFAYLGGTQDNGTLRGVEAAGGNWTAVRGGDGAFVAIDPSDANILYVENQGLSLSRSLNGGRSYRSITDGISEPSGNFGSVTPFMLDPNDPKRIFIGGHSLWRSADRGNSWTQASPEVAVGMIDGVADPTSLNRITAMAIAPSDSNHMMMGTRYGYIYSTASGLTSNQDTPWQSVQPRQAFLSGMAFDPADPNIAYAAYSTFARKDGDRHVYKTTDGGATWAPSDGSGPMAIPDVPVLSIVVDPTNSANVYAGTDLGVFVSLDGGASWNKEESGFPNTTTETLAIDRSGAGASLFAFTHGRGVWRVRLGTAPACSYTVSYSKSALSNAITVTTADGCAWSAISDSAWVQVRSPANGVGSGAVNLNIFAQGNADAAHVYIADQVVTIAP